MTKLNLPTSRVSGPLAPQNDREYQASWRDGNREKLRGYHRGYKRTERASRVAREWLNMLVGGPWSDSVAHRALVARLVAGVRPYRRRSPAATRGASVGANGSG